MHDSQTAGRRVAWVLRIGAVCCFVGHGAFGIIGKEAWLPYFGVVGISPERGWMLEPVVGSVDILMGILLLVRPRPAILLWMTGWALWTALLRPLSGESGWEAVERAGNYGVPLALLLALVWNRRGSWWFGAVEPLPLDERFVVRVRRTLVATTALLLVGHGMLSVLGKPGLIRHYAHVGSGEQLAMLGGGVDLALAALILTIPTPAIAIAASVWKLATESLFVVDGAPFWEIVERGGSYAAPLALAMVLAHRRARSRAAAS